LQFLYGPDILSVSQLTVSQGSPKELCGSGSPRFSWKWLDVLSTTRLTVSVII